MTFVDFLDWPVEIWAEVFSLLQPYWNPVIYSGLPPDLLEELTRNRVLELRLTCHKFKKICDTHPVVPRRFWFCQEDANFFIKKLLIWLKAGRGITSLTCCSVEPCLGMLVPQLLAAPTQLQHISMGAVNAANISCLSEYTSLKSIQLHMPSEDVLWLQPLVALKNLQVLHLHDTTFHDLPLGDKLTGLFIRHARVACKADSTSMNVLRNLSLAPDSCLEMPGIGIGTCTALTRLELQQSSITADDEVDWYEDGSCPPESVCNMLSLTNLSIDLKSDVTSMERFGLFPVLKRLHLLHSDAHSLSGDVAGLSKLQALVISPFLVCSADGTLLDYPFHTALAFDFDWAKLKGLKSVQIKGCVKFGSSVLQLAKLPVLS